MNLRIPISSENSEPFNLGMNLVTTAGFMVAYAEMNGGGFHLNLFIRIDDPSSAEEDSMFAVDDNPILGTPIYGEIN